MRSGSCWKTCPRLGWGAEAASTNNPQHSSSRLVNPTHSGLAPMITIIVLHLFFHFLFILHLLQDQKEGQSKKIPDLLCEVQGAQMKFFCVQSSPTDEGHSVSSPDTSTVIEVDHFLQSHIPSSLISYLSRENSLVGLIKQIH